MSPTEVIRNTEPTHADFEPLTQAMSKIEEIAARVNESKRSAEAQVEGPKERKEYPISTSSSSFPLSSFSPPLSLSLSSLSFSPSSSLLVAVFYFLELLEISAFFFGIAVP